MKPLSAYFAWLNDNRERITAELGGKGGPEVTKKGSEMWKALSEKERKPWEDKAKQEKEAYDAFLKTPEGAAKLQAYKDAKSAAKAEVTGGNDQDETATSPGSKRKQGDAAQPSPKKAKGGVKGRPAVKKQEESIQIPKDVVIACEAAQKKANADVSYEALVRKLLETERLAKQNLTPMQALDAIVSSKGLLNPARNMLISKLGA